MRRNRYIIYAAVAVVVTFIYYWVIRGIFSFNIYMLEGRSFTASYKKSSGIVRKMYCVLLVQLCCIIWLCW